MDILLKQRLIGAIVLISLAVIFLPMLFTGNGQYNSRFKSSIPPEPSYEIVSPKVVVPEQIPAKVLKKVPLLQPVDSASDTKIEQQPVPPRAGEATDNGTDNGTDKKRTKTKNQDKTAVGQQIETAAISPIKSPMPAKSSAVTGWVVQVGSFYRKNNAISLRDKLRKKGLSCFLITGKGKNGPIYRVRVGPELTQEKAKKVLKAIENDTKLKGMILRYP